LKITNSRSRTWLDDPMSIARAPLPDGVVAEIIAAVADEFGLAAACIMEPSRRHKIWKPRIAAMYCAWLLTRRSLPELGRQFGRSHTTVLRSCRSCRCLMDDDDEWRARIDGLIVRLVRKATGTHD